MKSIKKYLDENNPERAEIFASKAPAQVKKIIANIKDYEFYVGESMDPEGCVGLLNYREDGIYYFHLRSHSVLYFLEGRAQGTETLKQ